MAKTTEELLSQYTNLWKTKKAFDLFRVKNENDTLVERKDIIKEYGPKTGKPIKKVNRRELAHRVFSEYVRLYYSDNKGRCNCISCNAKMFWRTAQAGHFVGRAISKYTFDITNVYPQCYKCNCTYSGNYPKYTLVMIDKLGRDVVEKRLSDKETVELNQEFYEKNIIERYRFIQEKKKIIEGNTAVKNYDNLKF